ncbi:restriction endonuclease [Caloranaerobacter sp. DY30410]|uniref:restriction endonuclease n=1 Tax=Caloranaerobacter sp. DY30410 TaxID=3238305 RepID=UPI003CFFECEB
MNEIKDLLNLMAIKVINENRKYWLIRTKSGKYFDEFYFENFIAIGWNKICDLELIKQGGDELKREVIKCYPEEKRPGYVANQIIRFVKEIKKGDIVLVPNKDSKYIAFGEILDDSIYMEEIINDELLETMDESDIEEYLNDEGIEEEPCPYVKRRKVKWLKTINSDKLDPYLYRVLHSHNTISDANKYAHFIDRSLHSIFIKGDKAHVIYEVNEKKEIPAIDIINFINRVISIVSDFNNITNSNLNKEDIDLKINVQSPGPIEFSGPIITILVMAYLINSIIGGKWNIDLLGLKINHETEGLSNKILKYFEIKNKHEIEKMKQRNELINSINKLKIKLPEINEVSLDAIENIENIDKNEQDKNE